LSVLQPKLQHFFPYDILLIFINITDARGGLSGP
jgi:hypothetical protein